MALGIRWPEGCPGQASEGAGDGERPSAARGVGPDTGEVDPQRGCRGKLVSPARRCASVVYVVAKYSVSERFCVPGSWPASIQQRKVPTMREEGAALTADIIALATQYGRYG